MLHLDPVGLDRLQFAVTALYHFLFVPLTLGLSFMLAIMESVYVMTGRRIWRDITQFWGKLFGINFAMGVATGITMEFQFGTNWAHYSHYVGDIFGAPLAIEGLIGLLPRSHLCRPVLLRLGPALEDRPPRRHLAHGAWRQLLGAMGLDRQWLDAEPGRSPFQPGYASHGAVFILRTDVQPDDSGQVRAHRERGLCHRCD